MKFIKISGLLLFLLALSIFTSLLFQGSFNVKKDTFNRIIKQKGIKSNVFISTLQMKIVNKEFNHQVALSKEIIDALENANIIHKKKNEWDKVIWDKPHNLAYDFIKPSAKGKIVEHKKLYWWLTFGLGIIGALLFIIPDVILLGSPGIKNNGIFKIEIRFVKSN